MSIETKKVAGTALALIAALIVAPAGLAQTVEPTRSWEEDQALDHLMGTLTGPVWQPLWFDPGNRRGAPVSPLFLQQPPGAQEDFSPPPVITPVPAPAPPPKASPAPAPPPDPCAVPQPPKSCFP